jgi:hypothetical protein
MVRDTIKRQFDVDDKSVKYEVEPGTARYRNATVTFAAKTGKSVDLRKLSESLKATRLGKGTRSGVNYFEITAEGEVVVEGKETLLKVSGAEEQLSLGDDPKAKPKEGKSAYQRLKEALAEGEKITSVTGRVQGWSGVWPEVLRELSAAPAKKRTVLTVTDFETVKK